MKTSIAARFSYPYEEFADHMRAMKTVRQWEYTCRFGYLGPIHTSQAEIARAVEYFSDSYPHRPEALYKADRFLSIGDYIALHVSFFCGKGMIDTEPDGSLAVEPALLRAVHHVFTLLAHPHDTDPKKVLNLARALKALE